MDNEKIKKGMKLILDGLGEDLTRQGLINTSDRFARLSEDLFFSYDHDPPEISVFPEESSEGEIILEGIPFISFCEHHFVPFHGKINVKYTPRDHKVVGFGSISRVCSYFSARLQIQERLTKEIGEYLFRNITPESLRVEISAEHFCMRLHGEKKDGVIVHTQFEKSMD